MCFGMLSVLCWQWQKDYRQISLQTSQLAKRSVEMFFFFPIDANKGLKILLKSEQIETILSVFIPSLRQWATMSHLYPPPPTLGLKGWWQVILCLSYFGFMQWHTCRGLLTHPSIHNPPAGSFGDDVPGMEAPRHRRHCHRAVGSIRWQIWNHFISSTFLLLM